MRLRGPVQFMTGESSAVHQLIRPCHCTSSGRPLCTGASTLAANPRRRAPSSTARSGYRPGKPGRIIGPVTTIRADLCDQSS